tara:strand:+ start:729 stop:926 length:198 start_codon:yes stop_codon:yes gene_type:complete
MKINDKVIVERQIGKKGTKKNVCGVINRFSDIITIKGENTAYVNYNNHTDGYYYPLSKIKLCERT